MKNKKIKKNWSNEDLKVLVWIVGKYCEKNRIRDLNNGIVLLLPYLRRKPIGILFRPWFQVLVQKCVCLNGCPWKKAKSGIKSGKKKNNYFFNSSSSNQGYTQVIRVKKVGINRQTTLLPKFRHQQSFPLCETVPVALELLRQPQHQERELDGGIRQFISMVSIWSRGKKKVGKVGEKIWRKNIKCFKKSLFYHYLEVSTWRKKIDWTPNIVKANKSYKVWKREEKWEKGVRDNEKWKFQRFPTRKGIENVLTLKWEDWRWKLGDQQVVEDLCEFVEF